MKITTTDQIKKERGLPSPLGVSQEGNGLNFALFSRHADHVTLCLFTPGSQHPFMEIPLDREINRTGWVWHIQLQNLPSFQLIYGYRISGPVSDLNNRFNPKLILSDPYSKGLNTSLKWGHATEDDKDNIPLSKIILDVPFDWEDDRAPQIPTEQLIIYEMQVRSFTIHPSSKAKHPGTFLGVIEKIPYLKSLGINAVELLPIFEFNECELNQKNPSTGQSLKNVWGYSTINFFSPMNRFASSPDWTAAINEFRTMVKELHKAGIEVILDVVYNHTAEGNGIGPTLSFKGIDNQVYYMLHEDGSYYNYSGTGNTFNANHTVVKRLILDSLRYWVSDMHVDGFRFDLISCLTRGEDGNPLASPPLIQAMTHDPVLADVKLIAEAWDAGGLYQVGSFPGDGRFLEWNGKYRDVVRRFIKGTDDQSAAFARAMCGSEDLYGKYHHPFISVNFITAHDGFSLRDLVSYQEKHNEDNGEENRDGTNDNESWNCGQEGKTNNLNILALRERQMRNFYTALLLSIGTPMLLMGDEYGHTKQGNNNTYCQDNELNWFLWNEIEKHQGFHRFTKLLIQLRKQHPNLFQRICFLTDHDIEWHGTSPLHPNWSTENRLLAYTLKDLEHGEHLYIAFNANFSPAHLTLPPLSQRKAWYRIIDTSLHSPDEFCEHPKENPPLKFTYDLPEYSVLVAKCLS